MSANRKQWFYSGLLTTTATYKDNAFEFNGALNTIKMKNTGAESLKFSVKGSDDSVNDGELLSGESETFRESQANKIAVKNGSGVTTARIWAY